MSKILGSSIPQKVVELFNKELITVLLSTVTGDGAPHAMPVHLMTALDDRTIRMALMKIHQTTLNIKNNGKAFITVIEGQDIALGVTGTARVVKEPMDGNPAMCMVEFVVEEIKSDTTPTVIVTEGIRSMHRTEKTKEFFRSMFDELNKY